MFCVGWLPYKPSHAIDDVSHPVFDSALVIVIPFHIQESVQFPLPKCLIICQASRDLLDVIPVFDAWELQRGVALLQQIGIVHHPADLPYPTLDILVLFMNRKQVVRIDL